MRLILPMSESEIQTMLRQAADARKLGRLYAVREDTQSDETLTVSAKFSDSFGFVDHPRLTVLRQMLSGFRCDCADYRKNRRFCVHCVTLADAFFEEICPLPATPRQEELPKEQPVEPPEEPPVTPPSPPPIEQISYRFCNSRYDLYPGKSSPQIPLARYYQVFGKTAKARSRCHTHPGWGGSCFGFTISASMFLTAENPMAAPEFKVGALYPADLPLTARSGQLHMTLHTLLESMQILQYSNPLIQRPRRMHLDDPNCLDELCQRVLNFQQTGENPIGMGVAKNARFEGCHEVFPYFLEVCPDAPDRLHIYDPNHPLKTRYAYLEKDENGHYINWRFAMSDHTEYASTEGGQIFFDDYTDYQNAWEQRGSEPSEATMSVPRNTAILNAAGEVLFRVTAEGSESFCDNIYQDISTDMGIEAGAPVVLNLPAGNYLIRNEDPNREALQVMLSHVRQSITVTTNADEVEVTADDAAMTVCARITQTGRSYTIELDAIYEDDSRIILLEGVTAEGGLTFGCYNGVLRHVGALTEELANLYIDEELMELTCIEQEIVGIPQKKRILLPCTEQPEDEPPVTD